MKKLLICLLFLPVFAYGQTLIPGKLSSGGDFSGQLLGPGNSLIPSYSFEGDSDTGVCNPSPDTIGLMTGGVVRVKIDSSGNVGIDKFTRLGLGASMIKMKKLTSTTGATEGSSVLVAHGLTLAKIIGFDVLVTADNGNLIPMSFVSVPEFQFDAFMTSTNVHLILSVANSGKLLGNAFTVLLTYEE